MKGGKLGAYTDEVGYIETSVKKACDKQTMLTLES